MAKLLEWLNKWSRKTADHGRSVEQYRVDQTRVDIDEMCDFLKFWVPCYRPGLLSHSGNHCETVCEGDGIDGLDTGCFDHIFERIANTRIGRLGRIAVIK